MLRKFGLAAGLVAVIVFVGALATSSASSARATEFGFVTNTLNLPATNTEASLYSRNIDGRGGRDNNLGKFFANLAANGLDFQPAVDAAIDDGDLLLLHSLRTPSFESTKKATWQVVYGVPTASPDFSGAGSFSVAPSPQSPRLAAKIASGSVKTGAGTIPLRFTVGGDIFTLSLKKGKVTATCSATDCFNGRISGAIPAKQVTQTFIPKLVAYFNPVIARDCPGSQPNPCGDDSEGKRIVSIFDADHNLTITSPEISDNGLVGDFLNPDLDVVKANGASGRDGKKDSLSFGFAFDAVQAQLDH
jgi:hypothetical protein